VIEEIAKVNHIVFDKTGTITQTGAADVIYHGRVLTELEKQIIKSLTRNSTHPLSKKIFDSIEDKNILPVTRFEENLGKGISGVVYGHSVKIGSSDFVGLTKEKEENLQTKIHISIDDFYVGKFIFSNSYREKIDQVINSLNPDFSLSLLSGDNEGERINLEKFFGKNSDLHFNQSPESKLQFIKKLQEEGKKVLMLGDGLNDAGALSQSNVGIAVTDDISSFSPACDAILKGDELYKLPKFIRYSKNSVRVIKMSFLISLFYNVIGTSVAVQGLLSPIIAAILMPLSSISVVVFATVMTNLYGKRRGLS
jgi:Cu+-exporting ATPase